MAFSHRFPSNTKQQNLFPALMFSLLPFFHCLPRFYPCSPLPDPLPPFFFSPLPSFRPPPLPHIFRDRVTSLPHARLIVPTPSSPHLPHLTCLSSHLPIFTFFHVTCLASPPLISAASPVFHHLLHLPPCHLTCLISLVSSYLPRLARFVLLVRPISPEPAKHRSNFRSV